MAEKKLKLIRIPKTDKKSEKIQAVQWKPDNRPSIYFDSKQLPEISSWKVGEKYKLEIEIEMTSIRSNEDLESKSTSADFRINAVGVKE